MSAIRVAIHGGAGVIDRAEFGVDREQRYREVLREIAGTVRDALARGMQALDAAELGAMLLEDCPYFNAGRGAVLNHDGQFEFDASIMDGRDLAAGAVGACLKPRNPIQLARAILRNGDHVMLAGPAADRFARASGVRLATRDWFLVAERLGQLEQARRAGRISLDHDERYPLPDSGARGTIGCVVRDRDRNLAAATSTGGMTNKRPGRLGDTPIIGAGTYADNRTVAVSATGHGEYFMRCVLAFDLHARLLYGRQSLAAAASGVLGRIAEMGGSGGLIAIRADGEVQMPFNSPGMYRACVDASGQVRVGIYADDLA